MELVSSFLVILVLLFCSGFFSGSETSLFSLNKIERRRIQEKHPFIGKVVEDLLARPRRTLITILVGNMFVNTLATVIFTMMSVRLFGEIGISISIVFFTLILLMFGEIMPKVFAISNNTLISELSAVALNIIAKIIFPIRFMVRSITDKTLSFLIKGVHAKTDLMSEEELKALVRIGEEEGVLKKGEVRMISRLIDFGQRPVKQIMTPTNEFVAFDIDKGAEVLTQLIKKSQYTQIPVFQGTIDNFLGVIPTQEFMLNQTQDFKTFIQPPDFIPETKPIDELLVEFKLKNKRSAICVDEYGSVSGLVTFEDVLEEIFGEFHDEYAQVESLVKEIKSGEYVVLAKITLHELHDKLGISLESESSETLNGWILEELGRIPSYNESFWYQGIHFQIMEVLKRKIHKVIIRKKT